MGENGKVDTAVVQRKRLLVVLSLVLVFALLLGVDGSVNDERLKELREAVKGLKRKLEEKKTAREQPAGSVAQRVSSPLPPVPPPPPIGKASTAGITQHPHNTIIPIGYHPRWRWELGEILNREGKRHGAEIGVQQGGFSSMILTNWKCAATYMVVDVWEKQENYADAANVDQAGQDKLYELMLAKLEPWKEKLIVMRNWSHDASTRVQDASLDFVYVDARHDFEAVLEDMRDWWPKLRTGGILAGHDFTSATTLPGFGVQRDGSWDRRAVRGAVAQFSQEVSRPYVVIPETKTGKRKAPFASWMMRKS